MGETGKDREGQEWTGHSMTWFDMKCMVKQDRTERRMTVNEEDMV